MTDCPSGFPTLWELRQTGVLGDLELCATFQENGMSVEDKVNLVDTLEHMFSVKITDEEFAWAETPVRLLGVVKVHVSEARAS